MHLTLYLCTVDGFVSSVEMDMSTLLLLLCLHYDQGYSKTCSVEPTSNRVENAALNKNATQSSTYSSGIASKAVNGDTNPRYKKGSCSHTGDSQSLYQWWMVDLGREYKIDSVTITNRLTLAERQRDFNIFVSLNGTLEDDDHMTDDSLCYHEPGQMGSGETRPFTCQTPLFGQFVQIYMDNNVTERRNMHLCEVTVQGFPAVCMEQMATSQTTQTAKPSTAITTPATTTTSTPNTTMTSTTATVTSTTSMATSKPLSLPSNTTTTAPPTCPCVCAGVSSNTTNLTQAALVELVKALAKELKVKKNETSIAKRKLISVGDERQSAQTIGCIGVLALCVPVLIIVSFDVINLWSFASKKKNKVTPKRTDRETDRQTERYRERQTERQTERQRET